jgi:hypothetical protein
MNMSMKQKEPKDNLYLQFWRNPIFLKGLLASVNAEQWHTFTALAVFINDKGECHPSLSKLKQILGLGNVASVSRRISSLAKVQFEGKPLIEISKRKQENKSGVHVFANNSYMLNQEVVTIFAPHASNPVCREQQTSGWDEFKAKLIDSGVIHEKREDDKLTRRSF